MKGHAQKINWTKLVIAVLICEVTGFVSGWLSNSGRDPWFDTIRKPEWNPPGWIFGPVWTTLYLLMGIALYIIWNSNAPKTQKQNALWLFAIQLFLNFWWSMIFFRFHLLGWALVEIIMLWISILLTILAFSKISKTAAWLLVPYIAWVSFATLLTYTIWSLNNG